MNFIVNLFKLITGTIKLLFETVRVAAFVTNKAAEGMNEIATELEKETREYAENQKIERNMRIARRRRERELHAKSLSEKSKDNSNPMD